MLCGVLAVLLAMGLCACDGGNDTVDDTTPTTTGWEATAPEVADISQLVTAAEVTDAVGVSVKDGVLYEGGTLLSFASEDYQTQVSLLVEEHGEDVATFFSAHMAEYGEGMLTAAPNLGDEAYWCAETGELLVRSGNYMLAVGVIRPGMDSESALIAARQLAALAVERLK